MKDPHRKHTVLQNLTSMLCSFTTGHGGWACCICWSFVFQSVICSLTAEHCSWACGSSWNFVRQWAVRTGGLCFRSWYGAGLPNIADGHAERTGALCFSSFDVADCGTWQPGMQHALELYSPKLRSGYIT